MAIGFYDFSNHILYYNHEAEKLLNIKSTDSYLSLRDLLRVIKDEKHKTKDVTSTKKRFLWMIKKEKHKTTKRKHVLEYLGKGEPLDHFKIHTAEKGSKIYLTTQPVKYVSRSVGVYQPKNFGILMFFDKSSLFRPGRAPKNQKKIQNVSEILGAEFKKIYDVVENAVRATKV